MGIEIIRTNWEDSKTEKLGVDADVLAKLAGRRFANVLDLAVFIAERTASVKLGDESTRKGDFETRWCVPTPHGQGNPLMAQPDEKVAELLLKYT